MGVASESVYHQETLIVEGGMLSNISAGAIYVFDLQTGTEIFSRDKKHCPSSCLHNKATKRYDVLEYASTTVMATVLWEDVDTKDGLVASRLPNSIEIKTYISGTARIIQRCFCSDAAGGASGYGRKR